VLRIGFGLAAGTNPENGILATARNIALESLVSPGRDGRMRSVLADRWTLSQDRLSLRVTLRKNLWFHDGSRPSDVIPDALNRILKRDVGRTFVDPPAIRAVSPDELELTLTHPSRFLLEGLDNNLARAPAEPGDANGAKKAATIGTGPFLVSSVESDRIEMVANDLYHGGRPMIDKVVITPYTSVRSAWADMLRGQVDMLYEVGVDAVDSLRSSSAVDVFPFQRGYAFMVVLNVNRPQLRDPALRRALNAAIDRDALVRDILRGHGSAATGPVWPGHWAFSGKLAQFSYAPLPLEPTSRIRFTCLVIEPSHERLALAVQRQLRSVGVELDLEMITLDEWQERKAVGDFDAALMDAIQGPSLVRASLYWHSGGPFNWGGYKSRNVDAALDAIGDASDDVAYASGVASFQQAVIEDPPAIFLAWRERARAVSRRFQVPVESGDDILATIHQWKPRKWTKTTGRR
jgi:peptide/nickel transport system substrate-binding protein